MTAIFVQLGICLALYWLSKPVALNVLSKIMVANETYEDFLRSLLKVVYSSMAVVFCMWFLFGDAAQLVIAFNTFCLLTLIRFDFDDAEEGYKETRKQIIKIYNRDL
jgi:uncharacterized membrane protein